MIRTLLAFVGVVLAAGGQMVLMNTAPDNPNERSLQAQAGAMLIVGALLFGTLALRSIKNFPRLEMPRGGSVSMPAIEWRSWWAFIWFIVAVVLAVAAMWMFDTTGEDLTVGIIWLASIIALFVGQLWDVRVMFPRIAPENRPYLAVLAVLLIVFLVTRTYQLSTLPYNMDGDFADVGLQARALVTGQQTAIFTYGWAAIPILGYLPPWLSMSVFGTGVAGFRMAGVIEGLLIIVGVYLLGRDLFHARVGLFAAALLTISYTFIAASRQPTFIDPVLFLLYAIYFLLLGLREGRGWAMIASGVLTALCI
ncbi:MAG: glycosyltransferase family 39 protein, partial [Chloroflexota bacterium]